MKQRVSLYIDAPQHFRIASALLSALGPEVEAHVLSSLPAPLWFEKSAKVTLIKAPVWPQFPRLLRTLLRGVVIAAQLRKWARDLHGPEPVLVFNDTGIPQRLLLTIGQKAGWKTVLVQDGLTETQHREETFAFKTKLWLTKNVLAPLGLGAYGTARYGCGGASIVLADGVQAAKFFSGRAPGAILAEIGFIRPGTAQLRPAIQPYVLFWAVDFLGGLANRSLHEEQLKCIERLATDFARWLPTVVLRVRLHPGDEPHVAEYYARLEKLENIEIVRPNTEPFHQGLPIAALSLQSAGVFDSLAAGTPSFFLMRESVSLAPPWVPGELMLSYDACAQTLKAMRSGPEQSDATWRHQVNALGSWMKIPFDAQLLKEVLAKRSA